MMPTFIFALEILIIVTAAVAAWFWFAASRREVRRVSYRETLDAADLNRVVVALNRSMMLNRRGAAASGLVALEMALLHAINLFG
jgi:hypothetical protein